MTTDTPADPPVTPYQRLGGEPALRALVGRFYEIMDTLPETYGIRKLHPANIATSEEKLFMYLSGWLGGPQLFIEKYGHPRLRARHLPFAIGVAERDQWMFCMRQAMAEQIDDAPLRAGLEKAISDLADFMRNQPEEAETASGQRPTVS